MVIKIISEANFYGTVADEIAKKIKAVLKKSERASFALSGGRTPLLLYKTLTSDEKKKSVDWSRVDFFFGDERDVSPMSEKSNFRMANEFFFKPLSIPATQVFRWQTEIIEVSEVATQYEKTISRYFGLSAGEFPSFDLVMLGLGDDGHTASLFPYTTALEEESRLAVSNRVEKYDSFRLTMTYPVLNNAKNIIFMVNAEEKALALKEVLEGEKNCLKYPAQCIDPAKGKVLWCVGESAAGSLARHASAK